MRMWWASSLLLCALLPACGPSYFYKLDRREPLGFCSALKHDQRPEAERAQAMAFLRGWLGARLFTEALDVDDVRRLTGAAPAAAVGHGERTALVATTLSVARDEIGVELARAQVASPYGEGTWTSATSWNDKPAYAYFDVPLDRLGAPAGRPLIHAPGPDDPLLFARRIRGSSSFWSSIGNIFKIWGHMATLGFFLWGPRLAGAASGGGGPPRLSLAPPEWLRALEKADAWALLPANRAAARLRAARLPCAASALAPCTSYTIQEVKEGDPRKDVLAIELTYQFPKQCSLTDTVSVPLPAGADLRARLRQVFPGGARALAELKPPGPVPPPARAWPPVQVSPPPPPGPLLEAPAVHVLSRSETQQVLRVPVRPDPDVLLASCRVGGARCALRVETGAGTWAGEAGPREAEERLMYDHLRYADLLRVPLSQLLAERLAALSEGDGAPFFLLRRASEHRPVAGERVIVSLLRGGRHLSAARPLPPGEELGGRIQGAFAGAPAHPMLAARDAFLAACPAGAGAGCAAFAAGKPAALGQACLLGEGAACRLRAGDGRDPARRDEGVRLLRKGCLLGDAQACGEFARRAEAALIYKEQTERAGAFGHACGAGLLWACNDLAVLIGKLAEHDRDNADRSGSVRIIQELLQRACAGGEAAACRNWGRISGEDGRLDQLDAAAP